MSEASQSKKRKVLVDGKPVELDEAAAQLVVRLVRERDAARSSQKAFEREAAELKKLRSQIRNERLTLWQRAKIKFKKWFG